MGIIILCSVLGVIIGGVLDDRHETRLIEEAKANGWAPPVDIGDGLLFYLLVGTTLGFFAGVTGGSFWSVRVKAEETEMPHIT